VIEFAQVRDDVLAWPGVGANTLDESIVGVNLTVLGTAIASEKHRNLLGPSMATEGGEIKGVGFHYIAKSGFPLQKTETFAGNGVENRLFFVRTAQDRLN
jgi:hypothetical protein